MYARMRRICQQIHSVHIEGLSETVRWILFSTSELTEYPQLARTYGISVIKRSFNAEKEGTKLQDQSLSINLLLTLCWALLYELFQLLILNLMLAIVPILITDPVLFNLLLHRLRLQAHHFL
ncbi:uncharacterized protein LOC121811546 [Salvia splendens]|uniref:uncharacterized protein LOC121811546 n=1 Tax=Salvia splendens TaxID=180675 RepID=UPI001C27C080|nr:uncharacterized protein LOC121811546 [Salvia splendens]